MNRPGEVRPALTAMLSHDVSKNSNHPATTDDPIEAAARFVLAQPGWVSRVLDLHVRTVGGTCAECSIAQPTDWPCVLMVIARRAELMRTGPPSRRPKQSKPASAEPGGGMDAKTKSAGSPNTGSSESPDAA